MWHFSAVLVHVFTAFVLFGSQGHTLRVGEFECHPHI